MTNILCLASIIHSKLIVLVGNIVKRFRLLVYAAILFHVLFYVLELSYPRFDFI